MSGTEYVGPALVAMTTIPTILVFIIAIILGRRKNAFRQVIFGYLASVAGLLAGIAVGAVLGLAVGAIPAISILGMFSVPLFFAVLIYCIFKLMGYAKKFPVEGKDPVASYKYGAAVGGGSLLLLLLFFFGLR